MLSQSSQSYKDKHCIFFLICIISCRGRNENEVGALRVVGGETGRAGSREEMCDRPERWARLTGHFDCQLDWIKKKLGVEWSKLLRWHFSDVIRSWEFCSSESLYGFIIQHCSHKYDGIVFNMMALLGGDKEGCVLASLWETDIIKNSAKSLRGFTA